MPLLVSTGLAWDGDLDTMTGGDGRGVGNTGAGREEGGGSGATFSGALRISTIGGVTGAAAGSDEGSGSGAGRATSSTKTRLRPEAGVDAGAGALLFSGNTTGGGGEAGLGFNKRPNVFSNLFRLSW